MPTEATVADRVMQETFRSNTILKRLTKRSMTDLRTAILRAERIILDESMSEFMAELAHIPFYAHAENNPDILNAMRHSAILRNPTVWLEWNGRAFRRRTLELAEGNPKTNHMEFTLGEARDFHGAKLVSPDQVPNYRGHLCEQHPLYPNAVRVMEFTADEEYLMTYPFTWVWQTTDDPLPWANANIYSGVLAHGLTPYVCPQIGVILDDEKIPKRNRLEIELPGDKRVVTHDMVAEMGGTVRHLLALFATLSSIPVISKETQSQKGYVGFMGRRKYLSYNTLTLNIPRTQSTTRLAKRLIVAARRKWHKVAAHWRVYTQHAEHHERLCNFAVHHGISARFSAPDADGWAQCLDCEARRRRIDHHWRGDPKLGIVLHNSVNVVHNVETGE